MLPCTFNLANNEVPRVFVTSEMIFEVLAAVVDVKEDGTPFSNATSSCLEARVWYTVFPTALLDQDLEVFQP